MFNAVKKIARQLGDFIDGVFALFEFIWDTINDILYVGKLLGEFILDIPDYIGWLPSVCITVIITTFSIALIYKIIGR